MKEQQLPIEIASKAVLTIDEATAYCGFTRRYLLKLVGLRKLPAYKPNGKSLFFRRDELEAWLTSVRLTPITEIDAAAQEYCYKMKGGASK